MSDQAGMICDAESVGTALAEARALNADIRAKGIAYGRPAEAVRALQWQQMALASEAVLGALDHFIRQGGGSRGARAILDPAGGRLCRRRGGPAGGLSLPRGTRRRPDGADPRPPRGRDARNRDATEPPVRRRARSFFERDWPDWLTGRIFDLDKGGDEEC